MTRTAGGVRRDAGDRKSAHLTSIGQKLGVRLVLEGRADSRWARGPTGTFALLLSRDHGRGRWWFGLSEEEFQRRGAVGAILICESRDGDTRLGLPASEVRQLLPRLSGEQTRPEERKLHIVRASDGRFVLQMPGGMPTDLSHAVERVEWLATDGPVPRPAQSDPGESGRARAGTSGESRCAFFSRVQNGVLKPLDPVELDEGAVVRVEVSVATHVPANTALRRIVARGGPAALPPDLSEQHDHYAHGAPRR